MTETLDDIEDLATQYGIPFEDALFIDLNRKGVVTDTSFERIRFYFRPANNRYFHESRERGINEFFFALPTHSGISNYLLANGAISLGNEEIGTIRELENDTCDSTYPRREGTVINLNPNTKSQCHGCAFCHTFKQDARDISDLSLEDFLRKHAEEWLRKYDAHDLSHIHSVATVTGCFDGESEVIDYLSLVRTIFSEFGYKGEVFYYGSEITSKEALDELKKIAPFALCFSLECFENRDSILKPHKGGVSLETAKKVLDMSKDRGFGTNFSYIVGMEPLNVVLGRMEEFLPHINKQPVINIFQPHTRGQRGLLVPEARELQYFLDARQGLEILFVNAGLGPRIWENYRCLWYLNFGLEQINEPRLP